MWYAVLATSEIMWILWGGGDFKRRKVDIDVQTNHKPNHKRKRRQGTDGPKDGKPLGTDCGWQRWMIGFNKSMSRQSPAHWSKQRKRSRWSRAWILCETRYWHPARLGVGRECIPLLPGRNRGMGGGERKGRGRVRGKNRWRWGDERKGSIRGRMGEIGELGISRFRARDKKEKREGRVAGNGKENRQKKELAMGIGVGRC